MKSIAQNMTTSSLLIFLFLATLTAGPHAVSREMPQRLGIGFKDNSSFSLPSLALVYHMDGFSQVTGGLGIDTKKNESSLQVNAGIRYVIFHEKNMHFYSGGQVGFVSQEVLGQKDSGVEFNLVGGVEFFLEGLENLGWTVESGFGISSLGSTRVRTLADSPFRAGMTFYF